MQETWEYSEAEEGESEGDFCATEPRLRASEDSRRSWPVAVRSSSDSSEGPELRQDPGPDYRGAISRVCDDLKAFLLAKNDSYGNSAFEPINIMSRLDAREGILIRMDDKLKRIKNARGYPGDNDIEDLVGYGILLMALGEVNHV